LEYNDVAGLCKAAMLGEVELQGWSLNPGRYVGVSLGETAEDIEFSGHLEMLHEELVVLNNEARELEDLIDQNITNIIDGASA